RAYDVDHLEFGRDYVVPKPLDPRVCLWVAPAVAKAAMDTGVARREVDLETYTDNLKARLGLE
ncbi:MAG: malate dehydrogenase, partial [Anaerolineaceae bacterium]